jgi:hypothetical protein
MICSATFVLNVSINVFCDAVIYYKYLLPVNDIKTYHVIKSSKDCILLEPGIHSRQGWYTTNNMELKATKTKIIFLKRI